VYLLTTGTVLVFAANGHVTAEIPVAGEDRDAVVHGQIVAGPDGVGMAFYNVSRRNLTMIDAKLRPSSPTPIRIERNNVALSAGIMRGGEAVFSAGRERITESARVFHRLHDIVVVRASQPDQIILSGLRGAAESIRSVPKEPTRGTSLRPPLRYPARARYFGVVAAGGGWIYIMRGTDTVQVLDVSGRQVGLWIRPYTSSLLEVRSDTSFGVVDVVPLGMLVDSDGRLWLEQPRADRNASGTWDIVEQDGSSVGTGMVPDGCHLMAVGWGRLLCQHVRPGGNALVRLVSYSVIDRSRESAVSAAEAKQ
jgi:hypothetical protein